MQRETIDRYLDSPARASARQRSPSAWAEGRAMTLEQAVAYALDEQPSA